MTYEMRVDYTDGFEIVSVEAASYDEAKAQVAGAEMTTLLRTIDAERKPEVFLAW